MRSTSQDCLYSRIYRIYRTAQGPAVDSLSNSVLPALLHEDGHPWRILDPAVAPNGPGPPGGDDGTAIAHRLTACDLGPGRPPYIHGLDETVQAAQGLLVYSCGDGLIAQPWKVCRSYSSGSIFSALRLSPDETRPTQKTRRWRCLKHDLAMTFCNRDLQGPFRAHGEALQPQTRVLNNQRTRSSAARRGPAKWKILARQDVLENVAILAGFKLVAWLLKLHNGGS
ncbi:uncharacterized protein N7459_009315 [Penicillium hispanicum]|uniref:uncharacterized protein n=1 Tax=Penicillium hispanicum TaxID=1080232 RepID=UPI00254142F3|nr:uncharacterized protein N7459_009315 [Penicillium hispanicum]KAJ5569885.1 hypothetical protein N7459_009315 [Penicillium hispanicum]